MQSVAFTVPAAFVFMPMHAYKNKKYPVSSFVFALPPCFLVLVSIAVCAFAAFESG